MQFFGEISLHGLKYVNYDHPGLILGDLGTVSGAEDKVKTGGKKFDEQKYVEIFPARFDFVFGATNWKKLFSSFSIQFSSDQLCDWIRIALIWIESRSVQFSFSVQGFTSFNGEFTAKKSRSV